MNELTKKLAKQAGYKHPKAVGMCEDFAYFDLERFEELIRADEREQISHTYLKLTLEAVLRERDACARLCEEIERANLYGVKECAVAIRQRNGEQP